MQDLFAPWAIPISVAILALMLVAFARELMKPSSVAVIGAAACLAFGFVGQQEMESNRIPGVRNTRTRILSTEAGRQPVGIAEMHVAISGNFSITRGRGPFAHEL